MDIKKSITVHIKERRTLHEARTLFVKKVFDTNMRFPFFKTGIEAHFFYIITCSVSNLTQFQKKNDKRLKVILKVCKSFERDFNRHIEFKDENDLRAGMAFEKIWGGVN